MPSLLTELRKGWSLMIFCAPRNARSQTPLARANGTSRRASGWAGEKVARKVRSISPHPRRETKRAWRDHVYRPIRAVKGSLSLSLLRAGGLFLSC